MALDEYDFEFLHNEAEELVLEELERQLDALSDVCKCNDCVVDMAALALNTVRPQYRYSILGTLYSKALREDDEYSAAVERSVARAIEKVRANPSHAVSGEKNRGGAV